MRLGFPPIARWAGSVTVGDSRGLQGCGESGKWVLLMTSIGWILQGILGTDASRIAEVIWLLDFSAGAERYADDELCQQAMSLWSKSILPGLVSTCVISTLRGAGRSSRGWPRHVRAYLRNQRQQERALMLSLLHLSSCLPAPLYEMTVYVKHITDYLKSSWYITLSFS